MTRVSLVALGAAAMLAAVAPAGAATYLFNSAIPLSGGGTITGSGTIIADAALSTGFDGSFTGHLVRSISGTYGGAAIAGVAPVDVLFGNDDLVGTSAGLVDWDGIAFQLAAPLAGYGSLVNLYGANGVYTDSGPTSFGSLTLTQVVPEPATWAMMIVGLGGVGYALRQRRKGVSATVVA